MGAQFLVLLNLFRQHFPQPSHSNSHSSELKSLSGMFFQKFFLIFQQFIQDLNEPFGGLYQIRRSSVAAHLVSIKSAFQRDPIVREYLQFDRVDEDENPTDFD